MSNSRKRSLTPPHEATPIRNQADLQKHWRRLVGPLGFSSRQVWLNILAGDGRPTSFLTQLEELPTEPDTELLDQVLSIARQLLVTHAVDGSLALLLTRPGPDRRTASDVAWAEALTLAASRHDVPLRAIYLATDTDIRVIAPDDLMSVSA